MTTLGPYAALDHVFSVEVVNGDDLVLAALFAPLASAASPEHTYRISLPVGDEPGWIGVDEGTLEKEHLASIHHRLLLDVGRRALGSTVEPVLHGCLVERGGVGILVAGQSGSGKSTLTARLLADGGRLVTEDLTVLDATGAVRPYPRPLALTGEALELLGLPVPEDDCGCGCMKYVLRPEDLGGEVGGNAGIDVVLVCDHAATGVQELPLAGLLARLFSEASIGNADAPAHLEQIASALATASCLVLGTQDLDGAVAALDAHLTRHSVAGPVTVAVEGLAGGAAVYLDGEALLHVDGQVHQLDAVATAVWILHTEGLDDAAVAIELRCPEDLVRSTLARLDELELPAPAR